MTAPATNGIVKLIFFFSSRRRHTRWPRHWSSDVCSSDLSVRFDLTGPRIYHNLMPFLIVGGGATFDLSSSAPIESEIAPEARFGFGTRFAGQIGAGIEGHASKRVALRLDASDVFWKLRTPQAFVGEEMARSEWVQNLAISIGVVYNF